MPKDRRTKRLRDWGRWQMAKRTTETAEITGREPNVVERVITNPAFRENVMVELRCARRHLS